MFTNLTTFGKIIKTEQRNVLKNKQFGPDSKDHLFLFNLNEIQYILPKNVKIIESGYIGGTYLINKYAQIFLNLIPIDFLKKILRKISKIPQINKKLFNHIYTVVRK